MIPEERAFAAAAAADRAAGSAAPTGPGRRLSPYRVVGVLVVAALVVAAVAAYRSRHDDARVALPVSSFMPYVDVTVTPAFGFEDPSRTAATSLALGFVVSDPDDGCAPSWGAAYSLDAAAASLDLDRRIARTRQRGGDVVASFGGAANDELSVRCDDPAKLAGAYAAVVDRYRLTAIDLDVEGVEASSPEASLRRAQAIRAVQDDQRKAGQDLAVWLTLPIAPSGLTQQGVVVLRAMLAAKVDLAGVNAMTMDFGAAKTAGQSMFQASQSALLELNRQLIDAYDGAGMKLSADEAWQRIGATPMIGQNDVPAERFGLDDAGELMAFAQDRHLRRLSMWSLNRDQPCGPNYADVQVVSTYCSGIAQEYGAFTKVFQPFASAGRPAAQSSADATSTAPADQPTSVVDDPQTSPYQIWSPAMAYAKGTKVVWRHNVYEAKWWTRGDMPDAPVASASDTPWTLIGPVLPGERPSPTPTIAAGTYPQWSADQTYQGGDRVMYQGLGYQAKWYTHGDVPGIPVSDPGQTPWEYITS